MNGSLLRIIATLFLLFLSAVPLRAEESLSIQIHPYLPGAELLRRFTPLADYLSRTLEKKVTCHIAKNYEQHIKTVGADKVDIAFLGPASYVKIVRNYGKRPLLARLEINGSPYFRGVIVTSRSSAVISLKEIRNRRFAFGDPESTMSHLVPLYMLKKEGISLTDLAAYEFLLSHENVALGVLMGDFDAGAVKEEVFHKYKDRGLREVVWSPSISEHVFVARSNLPEKLVTELREALFRLSKEAGGSKVLTAIKPGTTALVAAQDSDYANLRSILKEVAETR